jgi:hypothetical protein
MNSATPIHLLFACLLTILVSPACMSKEGVRTSATHERYTPEQLRLSGKKGIGMTFPIGTAGGRTSEENDALRRRNAERMTALNVSWNYTWNSNLVAEQPAGVEFMPMIHGRRWFTGTDFAGELPGRLGESVGPHIKSGRIKRLLGPNEPDRDKHGDMTVEETLAIWPAMEALGVPLCSPSCANTEGTEATDEANQGTGGNWMPAFMAEADRRGLRIDYIGTHGYPGPNAEAFKIKLRRIYEKYGRRPLLITEFAVADWNTGGDIAKHRYTQAQVLTFMKELLPWMERQDWIAGYAWFSFGPNSPHGMSSALFDADNKLNALGRYYRSVTPENPDGDQSIQPD